MGSDGSWSKLEARIDHPQLRRPDSYLAGWHHADLNFGVWNMKKHMDA